MKIAGNILGVIWKIYFLLWFTVSMVLLFPFFYLLLLRKAWYPLVFRLKRIWAHMLIFPVGITYRVDYKFRPKPGKKYVYVANHSSYLDIILSYCVLKHYFVFMGKQELKKVPLFNVFFRDMNILVDRKSRTGSYKAFVQAGKQLDAGNSVILFPEGTISKHAPRLKEFKNGAFRLAIEKQVEIVPVTFENNWKFLQDKAFLQGNMRPGHARIVVHPPVSTLGMKEEHAEALSDQTRNIIEEPLKKYY